MGKISCPHCKGEAICKNGAAGTSCDVCKRHAEVEGIQYGIPCYKCDGTGKIDED